ncbi:MAG: AlkA N-terminal domain-containing protein, partial [Methylobacteriaceae bacterium]
RPPGRLSRFAGAPPVIVTLPVRQPYDWAGIRAFLAARAIPGVESADAVILDTTELDAEEAFAAARAVVDRARPH